MTSLANGRVQQLARLVAAGECASEGQAESMLHAEAALPADAVPQRPDDIIGRMDVSLAPPQGVRLKDWQRARRLFLKHAEPALGKLSRKDFGLSSDERGVMEAVVIADGSRPSFVLTKGKVSSEDPFLGRWGADVAAAEANGFGRLAAAVGRIQPQNGHAANFVGTGSLIDKAKSLILTNYHVLWSAEKEHGVTMHYDDRHVTVEGTLEIDFDGEAHSLGTRRFRIVEAWLPKDYGATFSGLDAAVARIVSLDPGVDLPEAPALLTTDSCYVNGSKPLLALVGFPAKPSVQDGEEVDWDFVIATLFGNLFGVKRAAPGRFTLPLGSNPADAGAKRAIGHDATTFGGASGSLVSAWLDTGLPAFAIHFGGLTEKANYALSFAAVKEALENIGLSYA